MVIGTQQVKILENIADAGREIYFFRKRSQFSDQLVPGIRMVGILRTDQSQYGVVVLKKQAVREQILQNGTDIGNRKRGKTFQIVKGDTVVILSAVGGFQQHSLILAQRKFFHQGQQRFLQRTLLIFQKHGSIF